MKRKAASSEYQDWNEVDAGLRRMGEIDIRLEEIEGDMTLRMNEIRAEYEAKVESLRGERKKIHANIELFAGGRKGEFASVRSKEMTFGTVAYRIVHKVVIRSRNTTVTALEAMGLASCLRITKEPDKEAMKSLDAGLLAKVGAALKTDDRLSIEPNIERISHREAA
jgi:phage host-nuclease inhibitor protein Gam